MSRVKKLQPHTYFVYVCQWKQRAWITYLWSTCISCRWISYIWQKRLNSEEGPAKNVILWKATYLIWPKTVVFGLQEGVFGNTCSQILNTLLKGASEHLLKKLPNFLFKGVKIKEEDATKYKMLRKRNNGKASYKIFYWLDNSLSKGWECLTYTTSSSISIYIWIPLLFP